MFCPKCSKENPEGAIFCIECGSRITPEEKPVDQSKPVQTQPKTTPTVKNKRGWGSASWVFIILQILLLAFFFINVAFWSDEPINLFFGGWIVLLFHLPVGMFLIFTEAFLGVVFSIIQLCQSRKAFSWTVFAVSVVMLIIMVVLAATNTFYIVIEGLV